MWLSWVAVPLDLVSVFDFLSLICVLTPAARGVLETAGEIKDTWPVSSSEHCIWVAARLTTYSD